MLKKFSEFIEEGMWGSALRRSNTGEERRESVNTQYIDLGLPSGTLWADRNIGATEPEEYGDFYAWGETEPKSEYDLENYKWGKDCTKYNEKDGKTVLDPEDDVVYLKTKGKAHIPTVDQIRELIDNTTSKLKKINGVEGRLYKSNINGNTIFLPFDDVFGNNRGKGRECRYWSSASYGEHYAYCLFGAGQFHNIFFQFRRSGYLVRGVKDK